MNNRFRLFVALAFYIGLSGPLPAQMVEARELLGWCTDGSPAGSATCTGYIMGIADAVTDPVAQSCPQSATRNEIREAVVRYMQSLNIDVPATAAVTLALKQAFPCRA